MTTNSPNKTGERVPLWKRGKLKTAQEIEEEKLKKAREKEQDRMIRLEEEITPKIESKSVENVWKGERAKDKRVFQEENIPSEIWTPVYKCWSQDFCIRKQSTHPPQMKDEKPEKKKQGKFITGESVESGGGEHPFVGKEKMGNGDLSKF